MKEEDYVMKLMSTYGALKTIDDARTHRSVTDENGQRVNKSFCYTEPYVNHFKYRHQVDDHNNLRHSPISLEMSMNTKDWKIRVFMFLMAIVEVNARLAYTFFNKLDSTPNQLEFRQQLAKELLNSQLHFIGDAQRGNETQALLHRFVSWRQRQRTPVGGLVQSGSTFQESTPNTSVEPTNAKNVSEPIADA
ncbi:Transposase IS4 [Fragilaria crotonensis]|nr:Transposase IS4 [Fragilaria crotonensis]